MQNTIAVIFDFDDTLASDSTSAFLKSIGVDVANFWKDNVQSLIDKDWDPIPAYLYAMMQLEQKNFLTQKELSSFGEIHKLHHNVENIFSRLRNTVKNLTNKVNIEFYLISSGIGDIIRQTSIAKEFKDIWACEFHYDDNGQAIYPKKIISFTDKTRYIFHIQKGLFGEYYKGKPFDVNKKFNNENLRIPLDQMIFVGDGFTDIPCFSLIKNNGGIAIGVYEKDNREKWGRAWGFIEAGRVSNLVPADYSESSALSISLDMAVESIVRRIELKIHTYQG